MQNFGNHNENGDIKQDQKAGIGQKQVKEQRTSGTMAQNIKIHDTTRHNQLRGSHKVYFCLQYFF